MKRSLSLLIWRILALAWMATIFLLSSQPSLPTPDLFDGQDKIEHFLAYGLLGILLSRSLGIVKHGAWKQVILVTALTTLYGISDEFHQSFVPGRDASSWDVLADGMGALMAAVMLSWKDRGRGRIVQCRSAARQGDISSPRWGEDGSEG